jgi:PHD/YefM family antitoxin component YafN of YafNO toxin-antitoxin module
MSIELTEQQQQVLDAESERPPRVIDPRSNAAYYLVAASEYEAIRELLDEEQRQKAIRAIGLRNAAGRIEEVP